MSISWRRGQNTTTPSPSPQPAATALADRLAIFWALDNHKPFSAPETRLYCHWLHQFHAAGWPASLPGREQRVAADVNMSAKGLTVARAGLVGRGLLTYEPSANGGALVGPARRPGWTHCLNR